jgi:hypothetical protein
MVGLRFVSLVFIVLGFSALAAITAGCAGETEHRVLHEAGGRACRRHARINRALRPGDEKALHIQGWRRLFEAAGDTFRSSPTF